MSYDEDMLLENDLNPKKKSKHERIIDQLKDIEEFDYNDRYTITFELKMITNDLNKNIPNKYRSYWLNINDFTFLDI